MSKNCLCGASEYMVLSCSGASDLGQASDLVARRLHVSGVRKMNCLAVVSAGYEKKIDEFKSKNILAVDGCPLDCARKTLLRNGIVEFAHLRITDLGYEKGKTEISDEVIAAITAKAEVIYETVNQQ